MPVPQWAVVLFEVADESVDAVKKIWLQDVVFDKDSGK
jgi:hypothetical protein